MKHLYKINNNSDLLNRSSENTWFNKIPIQSDDDKDISLITSLSMLETDNDEEPGDDLMQYLFNYSASLSVQKSCFSDTVCVYNIN